MMKNTLLLLILLSCPVLTMGQNARTASSDNPTKVAVYVDDEQIGLADFVSAAMVDAFVHNSGYIALERTDSFLKAINKEHEYQRTGMTDDEQIARLGKQFGTKYVCVVKIGTLVDKYFMQARLLDVETAGIINTTKALVFTLDDVEDISTKVVTQLLGENRDTRTIQGAFGY